MPSPIASTVLLTATGQPAATGPRGRADAAEGRSFGAALDRQRHAAKGAKDGQAPEEGSDTAAIDPTQAALPADEKKDELPTDLLNLAFLASGHPAAHLPQATGRQGARGDATATARVGAAGTDAATASTPDAAAALAAEPEADTAARDARVPAGTEAALQALLKKAEALAARESKAGNGTATADAAAQAAAPSIPVASAALASTTPAAPAPAAAITPAAGNDARAVPSTASASGKDAAVAASVDAAASSAPTTSSTADTAPAESTTPTQVAVLQQPAAAMLDRTSATAERPAVMHVAPPVGSDEWGPAVGQQMVRMSVGGHQVAELNLNPAGLGPLKVTLSLGDNQAQAMFVSAHESVRKAVEAALPQLRTTLAEQGISLGQTSVGAEARQFAGQQGFSDQNGSSRQQGGSAYPGTARADEAAATAQGPARSTVLRPSGSGVDTPFA